jgi:hypothetical protein
LPIFDTRPSLSLPPEEFCRGTSPSQAANCRPDLKAEGSGTLAASAVAVIMPTPGIVSSRWLASFCRCQANSCRSILPICSARVSSWAPDLPPERQKRGPGEGGKLKPVRISQPPNEIGHLPRSLSCDDPELGDVGPDRIEDHRPLTHQEIARPMQDQDALLRLGLDRHKVHIRPSDGFADGFT